MLKHYIKRIYIFLLLYSKVWNLIVSIPVFAPLLTMLFRLVSNVKPNNYPLINSYTMVCPPVRRDNPSALAKQILLKRLKVKEI